jgi:cation diffusion facilitator family transporter
MSGLSSSDWPRGDKGGGVKSTSRTLGYVEGWAAILVNTALFGVKYWAGSKLGSVAMVADAWHTLSDSLTSVVVIVGFFVASRPADKSHPFGHGRAEPIGAVIIAVLLGVVGVDFLRESIQRLRRLQEARFELYGVLVFLGSVVIKEGLAQFSLWAAKKLDSPSLKADGWHHRSDAIASALIVVGAFLGAGIWWMDGAMGIAVSALILYASFDILRTSTTALLGERPGAELEKSLKDIITRTAPGATHFHHLHVHAYGEHRELTFHLDFPPAMPLYEAHKKASAVEAEIREKLGAEATIHIEPSDSSAR